MKTTSSRLYSQRMWVGSTEGEENIHYCTLNFFEEKKLVTRVLSNYRFGIYYYDQCKC